MSRLTALLVHDTRLQYRYGIYAAYSVVVALYLAFIWSTASWLPQWAIAVIIFSDPAALGFFFLGALMMLEGNERVRTALAATPVSSLDYFVSKTTTLTAMALVACTLLALAHQAANPMLLLAAVALTSIQYVGIGIPTAYRFKTVNGYLVGSALYLTPLIAPGFLALIDPMPAWLAIIPAVSQMRLMLVGVGAIDAGPSEIALMLTICALAAAASCWLALRVLRTEFGK